LKVHVCMSSGGYFTAWALVGLRTGSVPNRRGVSHVESNRREP
jgi:hypothetical protein